MKHFTFVLILFVYCCNIYASSDSIVSELKEIIVKAESQKVINEGVEIYPNKDAKRAAYDANSLLIQLQIPQLRAFPGESIRTTTGEDVSMFINYAPANNRDLKALQPSDVLRIEVLDNPRDPRFMGSQHVVNFIVKTYKWGGLTKVQAQGLCLSFLRLQGYAFEKFAADKWSFDIIAAPGMSRSNKSPDRSIERFSSISFNGVGYEELTRLSETDRYIDKHNYQDFEMQALFQDSVKYLRHYISFNRDAKPIVKSEATVQWLTSPTSETLPYVLHEKTTNTSSSQSLSVMGGGYYRFFLPCDNMMMIDWSYSHSGSRSSSNYIYGKKHPIINRNIGRYHAPRFSIWLGKRLRHDNSLLFGLISPFSFYSTNYFGSFTGIQKITSGTVSFSSEYSQSWKSGFNLIANIAAGYYLEMVNQVYTIHHWYPFFRLELNRPINRKNRVALSLRWSTNHPLTTLTNTVLTQQNELLWFEGNPTLSAVQSPEVNISYSFVPSDKVNLFVYGEYESAINFPVYLYHTNTDQTRIIRNVSDNATLHCITAQVSVAVRPFNSIYIYADGKFTREIMGGIHSMNISHFSGSLQTRWYFGSFSLAGFWTSPFKSLANKFGAIFRYESSYGVSATCRLRDFHIEISSGNWFNKSFAKSSYYSVNYLMDSYKWGRNVSYIQATLTYAIRYGKKIDEREERFKAEVGSAAIQ